MEIRTKIDPETNAEIYHIAWMTGKKKTYIQDIILPEAIRIGLEEIRRRLQRGEIII